MTKNVLCTRYKCAILIMFRYFNLKIYINLNLSISWSWSLTPIGQSKSQNEGYDKNVLKSTSPGLRESSSSRNSLMKMTESHINILDQHVSKHFRSGVDTIEKKQDFCRGLCKTVFKTTKKFKDKKNKEHIYSCNNGLSKHRSGFTCQLCGIHGQVEMFKIHLSQGHKISCNQKGCLNRFLNNSDLVSHLKLTHDIVQIRVSGFKYKILCFVFSC